MRQIQDNETHAVRKDLSSFDEAHVLDRLIAFLQVRQLQAEPLEVYSRLVLDDSYERIAENKDEVVHASARRYARVSHKSQWQWWCI